MPLLNLLKVALHLLLYPLLKLLHQTDLKRCQTSYKFSKLNLVNQAAFYIVPSCVFKLMLFFFIILDETPVKKTAEKIDCLHTKTDWM